MPGIMPPLKAHHYMRTLGEPVHHLAFSFVTPLRADHRYIGHVTRPASLPAMTVSAGRGGINGRMHIRVGRHFAISFLGSSFSCRQIYHGGKFALGMREAG